MTYSITKTSGDIPAAVTISFTNNNEGLISTDKILLAQMNNMSTASNVYDVTYTVSASTDTDRAALTTVATRTISWTLNLIYVCYQTSPSISFPYTTNSYLFSEYFDDGASNKIKTYTETWTLNNYCTVNTISLFESDCSTAPANPTNFK